MLADYGSDWLLRHGIQRGIEIISEAARRIPADFQVTQPRIPWILRPVSRLLTGMLMRALERAQRRIAVSITALEHLLTRPPQANNG